VVLRTRNVVANLFANLDSYLRDQKVGASQGGFGGPTWSKDREGGQQEGASREGGQQEGASWEGGQQEGASWEGGQQQAR
jgi:hypothetical protein